MAQLPRLYINVSDIKSEFNMLKAENQRLELDNLTLEQRIKEMEELLNNNEHITKTETKLQKQQKVERVQAQEECSAEGIRLDNSKETVQRHESSSQKPKRRRVRKS